MPLQADVYVGVINKLKEKWKPHKGQIDLFKPLFTSKSDCFGQCGRNFGKTEGIAYSLWRWANLNPKSENYYFSPFMKQSREILWASNRLQDFGPREWIKDISNTEMRITFQNGAFIKADGSDNVESFRGIKPKGLSVYDEFKDFRPEFHEAYDPNRAAFESPLVIIGTPPDRECQYLAVAEEFKRNPKKHFFHGPTSLNPHISREWLEAKRQEYLRRNEMDVWQREYEAIYVPGGVSKIFPMMSRTRHVRPYDKMFTEIMRDVKKLEWFTIADPGAATIFGVLFAAINRYTKKVYVLDEIYEDNQAEMSVIKIGNRINKKIAEYGPRPEWRKVYDEAATWFRNEMLDHFNDHWEPTHKNMRKKDDGLSVIKDAFNFDKIEISDRCVKTFWELDNYYKDKNGKIPKVNDHLIDDLRYLLDAAYYDLRELHEVTESEDPDFRGARISDDFPGLDDFGESTGESDFD